jgi:hypothetical protein
MDTTKDDEIERDLADSLAEGALFWRVVEGLHNSRGKPPGAARLRTELSERLGTLSTPELTQFLRQLDLAWLAPKTRMHWLALSLILGHLADDEDLDHACAWLVAHGRAAWEQVLRTPDKWSDLLPAGKMNKPPLLKTLRLPAWRVLETRMNEFDDGWPEEVSEALAKPAAWRERMTYIGWFYWAIPTESELAAALPQLWARFGATWRPDHPASQGLRRRWSHFVREADVAELGVVRVGDTLCKRGERGTFTVLGINDDMPDPDDGYTLYDPLHGRYSAYVREDNGEVSWGRYLSGRYQYLPGEADPGVYEEPDLPRLPEQDALDEAYEAADQAMQDRVRAYLRAHGVTDVLVQFAAFKEGAEELPVDNLDARAVKGRVRFVETHPDTGERFESDVLTDPTWLQVCVAANSMMLALGYQDHVFLEGIRVRRPRAKNADAVATAKFVLGS